MNFVIKFKNNLKVLPGSNYKKINNIIQHNTNIYSKVVCKLVTFS